MFCPVRAVPTECTNRDVKPECTSVSRHMQYLGVPPTLIIFATRASSSFYWASVANAPNVLQPYWLIVLPLDVPDLTASLLL